MTKEDRQLLLKDLAARFPYGVVLDVDTTDWRAPQGHIQVKIEGYGVIFKDLSLIVNSSYYGDNYKPYLRPMSSMTEEEWEELNCIGYIVPLYDGCFGVDMRAYCKNSQPHYRRFSEFSTIEDWFNAHHFDYRGLIERGLAIAVTEENNPYKE